MFSCTLCTWFSSFKCDVTTCDIYLMLDKHHHVWKGNVFFFSFFLFPIILAKQIREWFEVHIDTKKWPYFLFQTIILGIHVSFQGCNGPLTTFCLTFKSSYSTTFLLPKTLGSLRRWLFLWVVFLSLLFWFFDKKRTYFDLNLISRLVFERVCFVGFQRR